MKKEKSKFYDFKEYTFLQNKIVYVWYIYRKWPTKENIQIKLEVEDEKSKRGERIGDEDFHRFYKNNRSNRSGK